MGEQTSFEEFIIRIRTGDELAAEELVRLYEPLVRREIRVKMTDRRMARLFDSVDVCQSIWSSFFVRVAAGQYDLESPQHLVKLLVTMAKNKLATEARRQHSLKRDVAKTEIDSPDVVSLPDRDSSPSTCLSVKELFSKIQENLSEEERKLSDLRRDGLTWEAVAQMLGGTAQARRMQLDRAAERIIGQFGLNE